MRRTKSCWVAHLTATKDAAEGAAKGAAEGAAEPAAAAEARAWCELDAKTE